MKKTDNQEEITISFEMAPKCDTCRLVATVKDDEDVQLTILHQEEGFIYFPLSMVDEQREDVRKYITSIQPKIESGAYQIELVKMTSDEACC
ncbi:hypothetical protein [Paraliobacillus salinarum]|uniref:hypothetical protein n=1 Tax=Paraliobacillus salinarum TaxID=1158996 RepID=UPI0015F65E42|nr:hypothetical protein [Paraliobacillus salinarum]